MTTINTYTWVNVITSPTKNVLKTLKTYLSVEIKKTKIKIKYN